MSPVIKFVVVMVVYALLLIAGGAVAFSIAPEGANAATALIVPAACATLIFISAVLAAQLNKIRALGMIGIHVGMVFPLLFAIAFFARGFSAQGAVKDYQEKRAAFEATLPEGTAADDTAFAASLVGTDAEGLHDKSYLRNTLLSLGGLSIVTVGVLIALRPKPAAAGSEAAETAAGD